MSLETVTNTRKCPSQNVSKKLTDQFKQYNDMILLAVNYFKKRSLLVFQSYGQKREPKQKGQYINA